MARNGFGDTSQDWTPAQIRAAIFEKGISQGALSRRAGLTEGVVRQAIIRPSAAGERAIAELLGVPVQEIWPSRWFPDGQRRRKSSLPHDPNARALIAQREIERAT